MGWHWRVTLALVAVLASLPAWSAAADPDPRDPAAAEAAAPTLLCNGRPLASDTDLYACRVLGATPDDTSFVLRASLPADNLADDTSQPQVLDPFCTGDLDEGTGVCTQTVAATQLVIDGTLLPSGQPLPALTVIRGGFLRPPGLLPPSAQ